MSLLFIVVSLLAKHPWTEWAAPWLVFLAAPTHMFFQAKGAYALGWFSALWRTFFLIVSAFISIGVFFVLMLLVGVLG
jgi:hypothetical protein